MFQLNLEKDLKSHISLKFKSAIISCKCPKIKRIQILRVIINRINQGEFNRLSLKLLIGFSITLRLHLKM